MFKKVMTIAMVVTMLVASLAMASAETVTNAGWWDDWSKGYELADGATLEFDVDQTASGTAVFSSLNAIFANVATDGTTVPNADNYAGYAEYVVLRSDNFGWGAEYDAGHVTYTGTDFLYGGEDVDYAAILTGAHYDVTISRSGNNISYDIVLTGGNDTVFNIGYDIAATDLSAGCYVFFTGDAGVSMDITLVEPSVGGGGSADDSVQTGDMTNFALLAGVAALALVAVVASKKAQA